MLPETTRICHPIQPPWWTPKLSCVHSYGPTTISLSSGGEREIGTWPPLEPPPFWESCHPRTQKHVLGLPSEGRRVGTAAVARLGAFGEFRTRGSLASRSQGITTGDTGPSPKLVISWFRTFGYELTPEVDAGPTECPRQCRRTARRKRHPRLVDRTGSGIPTTYAPSP